MKLTLFFVSLTLFFSAQVQAQDLRPGDILKIKEPMQMQKLGGFAMPLVHFTEGKVKKAGMFGKQVACSINAEEVQFVKTFGSVGNYKTVTLTEQNLVVTKVDKDIRKRPYAVLMSESASKFIYRCFYVDHVKVGFQHEQVTLTSIDIARTKEACGELCSVRPSAVSIKKISDLNTQKDTDFAGKITEEKAWFFTDLHLEI